MTRAHTLKVYGYEGCDTCRKAFKYLEKKNVSFERISIVDRPPPIQELREMLEHLKARGGDFKRLLNTSGQVYREMNLSKKLPSMTEAQVLELLVKNGKLIKRPFALSSRAGAVGFKEDEWTELF